MPTMVSTRQFGPYIRPHAPGVSLLTAEYMARMAAIEFCERTRCWRETFGLSVTQQYFELPMFDFATTVDVSSVIWNGERRLEPVAMEDLPPDWATMTPGTPETFTTSAPGVFIVLPFEPGVFSASVYLKPRSGQDFTITAADVPGAEIDTTQPLQDYYNQVPNFLLIEHAEAIASGALARILAMPQQKWSDPGLAAYHRQQFDMACNKHFSLNMRGQQRAPRRTRYVDF